MKKSKEKQCTGDCKEVKPCNEFYETKHLSSKCMVCILADRAAYRQANLEKVRKQGRVNSQKYRDNHQDEFIKIGEDHE